MEDPYDLERFVLAQSAGGTYDRALAELKNGGKQTHWMWFVFPQIAGLGQSPTSRRFGISSLAEAEAYLRHPVLGARLIECTTALAETRNRTAEQIFGAIDTLKLQSSMTLFRLASPSEALFGAVLERHFDGLSDIATADLVGQELPSRQPTMRPEPAS